MNRKAQGWNSAFLEMTETCCQLTDKSGMIVAPFIVSARYDTGQKEKKMERKLARIFEDVGGYYVCDEELDYLDASGKSYKTKAEAQRAAKEMGYTHAVGSGTYTNPRPQKL